jgi:hypothetical protein
MELDYCYDCGNKFPLNCLVINDNGKSEFQSCIPCFELDCERVATIGDYVTMIKRQMNALHIATGLNWEHEGTGGGCDALVAYFDNPNDDGSDYVRTAYVMLTCDAGVIELGRDTYATLGFYSDSQDCDQAEEYASLGDEKGAPLELDALVAFVADHLVAWGVK